MRTKELTIIFLILCFLPSNGAATIRHVPSQYSTIQSGMSAAYWGDTVLVQPGTYIAQIGFGGKGILLKSSAGPEVTIIEATSPVDAQVVSFTSSEDEYAIIDGFTIKGAVQGIRIYSSPIVRNNVITGNEGGIICSGSDCSPQILNNVIRNNGSTWHGGGINVQAGATPLISGNVIRHNTATNGGGIYVENSNPTISYNLIRNNSSANLGSGVKLDYGGTTTLIGNVIAYNENVGFHGDGSSIMIGSHNTIAFNNNRGFGCNSGNSASCENCIVWANAYPQAYGSATITYSDVMGGWAGEGNIDEYPMFCDAANYDFGLLPGSPCLGSGSGGEDMGAVGEICLSCGDGVWNPWFEECDDGNLDNGDGCSSTCEVEWAWICEGSPSNCYSMCRDGLIAVNDEGCDDLNTADGDGCSSNCTVEPWWRCGGEPSVCGHCGDADGSGDIDIDDVVYLIAYIFSGGPEPVPVEVSDADCSGEVDIDDVVYLIAYIFAGGTAPCDPSGDQIPDC